jgi:hypothetical protein
MPGMKPEKSYLLSLAGTSPTYCLPNSLLILAKPSKTKLKRAGTRKMVKTVDTKRPPTTTLPRPL